MNRNPNKLTELEHAIYMLQIHGPVCRALGISTKNMDSMTVWDISGTIANDEEVRRRCFAISDPLKRPPDFDTRALLMQVLEELDAGARAAIRQRVLTASGFAQVA
jgi:hypothetical protein